MLQLSIHCSSQPSPHCADLPVAAAAAAAALLCVLQDDRIVFLANVWLDRPDTFEALHTLLSGEQRAQG
jgi:hypothetical protein